MHNLDHSSHYMATDSLLFIPCPSLIHIDSDGEVIQAKECS